MLNDPITLFGQAAANAGLPIPGYPIADGELHRYKTEGDKQENCWYVLYTDDAIPAGAFGCWKRGQNEKWCSKRTSGLNESERRKLSQQIERAKAKREKEQARTAAEAKQRAGEIWEQSSKATLHPYLSRKQVRPYGIRIQGDRLVVPMTIDTRIHSLQFIHPDGFKQFMPGGRVKGCYYPIGKLTNQIWIAEGFATAATVFETTGVATVCAFNAGNLIPVTEYFVAKGLQVYIAADNDEAGWEAAGKARLVGAECRAAPDFNEGHDGTDWNDFRVLYGAGHTKEVLSGA